MEEGAFRRDLYYRLKIGHIVIPPLRDRREEIVPLAKMFLREFAQTKRKGFAGISSQAGELLEQCDWPGNVRELRNAMDWVVFMYDDTELQPFHLEKVVQGCAIASQGEKSAGGTTEKQVILPLPDGGLSIKEYNDLIIQAVLDAHNGNQTATAKYLDMSLRALCYRLEQMRNRNAGKKEE
ncbi:Transcriptional regulatory protein ZraR [Sporomusa ovata DSM 2662]|nr:helix-turn-helix domain-containing protein [Sporomusa ovata]EQB27772.1 acetoacetate metabolism regulatory protein AtoC [Sporomusa ovata DSM 2662]